MEITDLPALRVQNYTLQVRHGSSLLHFDRTGRFVFSVHGEQTVRRGLDHRMLEILAPRGGAGRRRRYRDLPEAEKRTFLEDAYRAANEILASTPGPVYGDWRASVSSWTPERLAADREAFERAYLPISILPPDRYRSIVVQLTEGCSYNRCVFCDFYQGRPFRVKTVAELRSHLALVKEFFKGREDGREGVFLADGNALVAPSRVLLPALSAIAEELGPSFREFSTFMDTFTLERKSRSELEAIRARGLVQVYSGLETGSDRLRKFLAKPGASDEAVESLNRLKEAGFRIGVIVMVGAGGAGFSEEHFEDTARAVARIKLDRSDILFLSPFVEPRQPAYRKKMEDLGVTSLTDGELSAEVERWTAHYRRGPARVTLYPIQEHLY